MILVRANEEPNQQTIQIVGQFDGSCFREEGLGGAGYVIYAIEGGCSKVLACRSVGLPTCTDNIEAETLACQYLVEEIATLVQQLLKQKGATPRVVIQGDILPVIKYFQFAGRLRRIDLAQPLELIRTTVSRYLSQALFIYLPRVANSIADDLAGQASRFILMLCRRDGHAFHRDTGPVSIKPTLPIPLLQVGGFHIQSFEPPWAQKALILVEKPFIDHGLLRRHLSLSPHHRTLIESYLSPCMMQQHNIEVAYSPRADDSQGRKYCITIGGQRLPREVRPLLFGHTHYEVDLKGSFYELIKRLGLRFLPQHVPLPKIDELRNMLARDLYIQAVEAACPQTIKRLPLRIINSSIEATYYHLQTIISGSPGPAIDRILRQLWSLSRTLTEQLLPRFRPTDAIRQSDSTFRLLEYFEAIIVEDTIKALIARHPTQSAVWLHDGFLIYPPPPEDTLRHVEAAVLARHQLYCDQTWFKTTSLADQYKAYKDRLRSAASAPTLAPARRNLPRQSRPKYLTQGPAHTCMSPLEALAKLRTRRGEPFRRT